MNNIAQLATTLERIGTTSNYRLKSEAVKYAVDAANAATTAINTKVPEILSQDTSGAVNTTSKEQVNNIHSAFEQIGSSANYKITSNAFDNLFTESQREVLNEVADSLREMIERNTAVGHIDYFKAQALKELVAPVTTAVWSDNVDYNNGTKGDTLKKTKDQARLSALATRQYE